MDECGRDIGDEMFRLMKPMEDEGDLLFLETSRAR
jgi:hypothetical protein